MNLRDQIISDSAQAFADFGDTVVLTSPDGNTTISVAGLIRLTTAGVDMMTGQTVAARVGSIAVQAASLAGNDVTDWKVDGVDINGTAFTAYVNNVLPDQSMGMTVLMLRV